MGILKTHADLKRIYGGDGRMTPAENDRGMELVLISCLEELMVELMCSSGFGNPGRNLVYPHVCLLLPKGLAESDERL